MEEKKPESRLKAAQYGFLALIFLALTLLLFLGFRTDKALTTSLQKIDSHWGSVFCFPVW